MAYKFPSQLFPSHFNAGPPRGVLKHNVGKCGSYERILGVNAASNQSSSSLGDWTFTSRHQVKGGTWLPSEPVVNPLLYPGADYRWSIAHPDPVDCTEHMANFYQDNYKDAFYSMSSILEDHIEIERRRGKKTMKDSVYMRGVKSFMTNLEYKKGGYSHVSTVVTDYERLLADVIHDIPPELLADLLHEELTEQRDKKQFSERFTGGTLAFVPFTEASSSAAQHGCLICPGNQGLDCLNFQKIVLRSQDSMAPCLELHHKPFHFKLKSPARQISSVSLLNESCVAVRSDYLCGVWRLGMCLEPHLLEVIHTKQSTTCISASPHVLGEVLVASESGAVHLWTVGKGVQKWRKDDSNLYFNARSQWRWCEFSAHPRVIVYADRTGAELTDIRAGSSHTLFRIGQSPECRSGERVILTKYLGDVHSFHHLITTQNSAYIMDERFPCMPMLKWDHMMQCPPMFCQVLRSSASSCSVMGVADATTILLGSQTSQEIFLFQYSGGRSEACVSLGPPQALLRPRDSLNHLPVQIPHRRDTANSRLSLPAAGLTCIQKGEGGSSEECVCILQLTEAGDIFYQILTRLWPEAKTTRSQTKQEHLLSQVIVSETQLCETNTLIDEEIIGPTQDLKVHEYVAETPEREQPSHNVSRTDSWRRRTMSEISASSSEDLESKGRHHDLASWGLEMVVNDESDPEQRGLVATEVKNVGVINNKEKNSGKAGFTLWGRKENVSFAYGLVPNVPTNKPRAVKLSDEALLTWRRWLLKLVKNKYKNMDLQKTTFNTKALLIQPSKRNIDPCDGDPLQSLRQDLRGCMMKGSLLVHSATYPQPLEQLPIPNPVDTTRWCDDLSQVLTLSWQGEELWKNWWVEKLGLNRDEKMDALRRKRRRQKEAKRAHQHLGLSGSFTSSISYQSDFDDHFSLLGSFPSTSQEVWSEGDEFMSQSESWSAPETHRKTSRAISLNPTLTDRPQKLQQPRGEQQRSTLSGPPSLSSSRLDVNLSAILPRQRPQDCLDSLFGSQESSQLHYTTDADPVVISHPISSSYPTAASIGVPKRTMMVDLSQPRSDLSRASLSQSVSLSQSSQGKPKSKKSRMGF
ncbi:TATA box-binding protein-associated factor RNA polymerase I subunit C [Lampris incognitus]|uniref:TATA box-binding protein-associated factor RNA polymerase I subunit C n=1 Tax=Lampris incognitus TaxID=2546036 RepID=UPI0024B575DD|nr:TATA box-binding protein-associated factor RNA polymerase I subunit C [Lampris incognitus]XP_056146965.1 TATA box-binding protein-associated factor RNA polymerase I subunit C [Lampris incognitus]